MIDERAESINNGYLCIDMRGFRDGAPDNPECRIIDGPAFYHNGAGSLNFGDGHAEIRKWVDRRTTEEWDFEAPSAGNRDIYWLQQRTTGLK